MKRKSYTKPTMKVVELKHRTQLLQSSVRGFEATRSGYGAANARNWDDEE